MDDGDDQVLARFGAATIFLIAAGISLLAAWLGASMESYTSWSDPEVVKTWIFSAACVVAAGLCFLPWGTWPARVAGFVLIAPAVYVMNAAASSSVHGYDTLTMAAAVAIVLMGGALAGGLHRKLLGRSRG